LSKELASGIKRKSLQTMIEPTNHAIKIRETLPEFANITIFVNFLSKVLVYFKLNT
jgi:hypothetical protein